MNASNKLRHWHRSAHRSSCFYTIIANAASECDKCVEKGTAKRPHCLHLTTPSTHFNPTFYFYTPWKRQETFCFLKISGGIEMEYWAKMGLRCFLNTSNIFSTILTTLTLSCIMMKNDQICFKNLTLWTTQYF